MAAQFRVTDLLEGNCEQVIDRPLIDYVIPTNEYKDAACLSAIIGDIQHLLSQNAGLAKKVKYNIEERGHADLIALSKIVHYRGPDSETIETLNEHSEQWLREPSRFWKQLEGSRLNHLGPQSKTVAYFLHNDGMDA